LSTESYDFFAEFIVLYFKKFKTKSIIQVTGDILSPTEKYANFAEVTISNTFPNYWHHLYNSSKTDHFDYIQNFDFPLENTVLNQSLPDLITDYRVVYFIEHFIKNNLLTNMLHPIFTHNLKNFTIPQAISFIDSLNNVLSYNLGQFNNSNQSNDEYLFTLMAITLKDSPNSVVQAANSVPPKFNLFTPELLAIYFRLISLPYSETRIKYVNHQFFINSSLRLTYSMDAFFKLTQLTFRQLAESVLTMLEGRYYHSDEPKIQEIITRIQLYPHCPMRTQLLLTYTQFAFNEPDSVTALNRQEIQGQTTLATLKNLAKLLNINII